MNTKTKACLLISSFLQTTGLYFLYVKYSLLSFHPAPTHLDFLPITFGFGGWHPEIEIPLYLGGYVVVTLLGSVLYLLAKHLLRYIPQSFLRITSSINARISSLALLLLWWMLIKIPEPNIFEIFVIYISLMCINNISLMIRSKKITTMFTRATMLLDFVAAITLSLLSTVIVFKIFFTNYFYSPNFIDIFQKLYLYIFFQGFYGWQFLLVSLSVAIPLGLYIVNPRPLSQFFKIKAIRVSVDFMAIGSIIFFISIISPWIREGKELTRVVHDYIAVVGPINDILSGKSILVNSFSQYGLMLPYGASVFFKFIPLSLSNFFILTYLLTIVGMILIYITLRIWLRSFFASIVWIFLMVTHYLFALQANILLFCMNTFLRYGWWVIVLFFLLSHKYLVKNKKVNNIIELALIGISVFWATDTGTYVLLGYFSYIVTRDIQQYKTITESITSTVKSLVGLSISLGIMLLSVITITYVRSGQFPNWQEYFFHISIFSNGYALSPMPAIGHYLIFIVLHVCVVLYVMYSLLEKTQKTDTGKKEISILSFLTSYAIANFLYYIGESRSNDVEIVMLPSLVLFSWVIYRLLSPKAYSLIARLEKSEKAVAGSMSVVLFLLFSIITTVAITNIVALYPHRKPLSYFASEQTYEKPYYTSSVNWLNDYLKNIPPYRRKIALISQDDWYYLLTTKSTNVIDSGNNYYFLLKSQFQKLCTQLFERKPQYLFIDTYQSGFTEVQRSCARKLYHFKDSIGSLDRWELNQ